MGLFSRRNRTRKDASRAIRSITDGLMGGNSQQNYQDDVMSSLENISEQLGSIGATSAASSSIQTPNVVNDVNDTASATMIDPTEVQESMMGDNNPASVSSALLKRYKGSCKMKLKNK